MTIAMNRRQFLAVAAATTLASRTIAAAPKPGPWVCVFSKHLQFLDYKTLAKTCRDAGLDGIDLTVREKGHVLPENITRDLPAAVESVRGEGLDVYMITTRLMNAQDPTARPILETAAKQGIKFFRIGGHQYDKSGDILPQINRIADDIRGLAQMGADCGMTLGYHNHSGFLNFGAPVWDLARALEMINMPNAGSNYDPGHAMAEGGFGDWEITARMMAPHVRMMAIKDFVWDKDKPKWVPLGMGIVKTTETLRIMRQAQFQGPISLHFEYPTPSDEAMIEEVRNAVATLRACLQKAGYG